MSTDYTTFNPRSGASFHPPKKRPSRTFWIKALAEFSKSGLSAQEFCRLKNLSPSNFYTWRKRLRDEEDNTPPAPAIFIPLDVKTAANSPTPSKKDFQSTEASLSPAMEKAKQDSGLSIHLNERLKISLARDFHGPTLQRLVQMFSLKESATC